MPNGPALTGQVGTRNPPVGMSTGVPTMTALNIFVEKMGCCPCRNGRPGLYWRIWSARAEKGRVKIYLDGQEKPAVDLPFENYFDGYNAAVRLSGIVLQPQ